MCRIDLITICGMWCALGLCAWGQDGSSEKIHRIDNPEAWMSERAKSNDRPDPHRPMSPEMKAVNPALLDDLGADELAKMSLDDPLLKYAYAQVFLRSIGAFEQLDPKQEMALADMRRRGEAVSPMLLKLIEENQETRIETMVLGRIEHLGTVRLEPFLEYSRKLLRERTRSEVVAAASRVLAQHGTNEDVKLFEWVLQQKPFAITDLTKCLKILRDRLDSQAATRPERRDKPTSSSVSSPRPSDGTEGNHLNGETSAASRLKPWIIGGLILVVLLGASRLLFKRLHR